MSVYEHVYGVPGDDELAQLVGAATPHFALQARDRVAAYAAALPPDHPRQVELTRQLERLEALARTGEGGRTASADLPTRPSLDAATTDAATTDAAPPTG